MRRHARFEPAQIAVPVNHPKIPTPPIIWEMINLIEWEEQLKRQPWVNPYEELDYSKWVEEEEEYLDFPWADPYRTGESNFDEVEGEYVDPLDGISLASLFDQSTLQPTARKALATWHWGNSIHPTPKGQVRSGWKDCDHFGGFFYSAEFWHSGTRGRGKNGRNLPHWVQSRQSSYCPSPNGWKELLHKCPYHMDDEKTKIPSWMGFRQTVTRHTIDDWLLAQPICLWSWLHLDACWSGREEKGEHG